MGPAEWAIVISTVASLYGQLKDAIIGDELTSAHYTIDQAANKLRSILYRAYQKNSQKAAELESKLSNLSFIRRTPALNKAVSNMAKQLKLQQTEVSEDENTLRGIEIQNDFEVDNAKSIDSDVMAIRKAKEDYNTKNGDLINETQKILEKYN